MRVVAIYLGEWPLSTDIVEKLGQLTVHRAVAASFR